MDATLTSPLPYATPSTTGERLWIVGDTMRLMATAETTGGSLTLLENVAAPGGGPPPHVHEHEDEAFYVLEGTFEILLGDEVVRAGPGDFAFVPRGTVHRFANVGDAPARILVMFTPGGMDGFFRAAGTPALGDGPAPPLDEAEIARTGAAAGQYGMRIVDWPADRAPQVRPARIQSPMRSAAPTTRSPAFSTPAPASRKIARKRSA